VKKCPSEVQRVALGFALALLTGAVGGASQSPYTSIQGREIKALSPEQIEGYETGQGMSLALAAEMNGYPGPKHVLEFQGELDLTDDQRQSTEAIFNEMKRSAEDLGHQIVNRERELDRLFSSHTIDVDSLGAQIERIAELQGQLRTVHLQAHLDMMGVLNEDQISQYIELRGYHGGGHQGHRAGQSHGEND
jgi:Spy/CpxP family protein refolding chaperone